MLAALVPSVGVRWLLVVIAACAIAGAIWLNGASHVQAQWDLAEAQAEASAADLRASKSRKTVEIVTRFVDRVQYVRDVGRNNEKEAPAHVTPEADAACTVPAGFVRLHDAAAAGNPSAAAGTLDARASGIPLSTVGAIVAINYARGLENIEQVKALQAYILETCQPVSGTRE